jgi:hypothetical protein
MAEALFGEQYLTDHTVLLGNINSNSPLTFDGRMLGALRVFAAHNSKDVDNVLPDSCVHPCDGSCDPRCPSRRVRHRRRCG